MLTELICLRPFQPGDQVACKALILAGLVEHWGFLDPTLNPDLNDIADSFSAGYFLTAWREHELVGTGGFLPAGRETLQIVRMSVAKTMRGQGLGQRILVALLAEGCARGYRRAVLETTETWGEVVRFYLKAGFRITHRSEGDVYFEKALGETS
jgi:putative acetyltransferase